MELAARAGWFHRHEAALQLFPTRSLSAATRAARRAIRNSIADGLIERRTINSGLCLYGLTKRGARWLEDYAAACATRPTLVALHEASHVSHRRIATQVAIVAEHLGCRVLHERECLQQCKHLAAKFHKIPDILVEWTDAKPGNPSSPDAVSSERIASWHEVELSRRNKCGRESLRAAIEALALAGGMLGDESERLQLVALVFHVRRGGVERELRELLATICRENGWPEVDENDSRIVGPSFAILLEPLPPQDY